MAKKPQVVNLSKETLDQITPALHSMRDSLKNQTRLLTDTFNLQNNELRAAERRRGLAQSQADGQAAALAAAANNPASPAAAGGKGGGIGGLGLAGLAGLGGLAAGAMKGVGGLALLGIAIPTFFGGLLAGSETLSWLQETKGMDFEGLKTASLGFSEVIKSMDPKAFVALGAITAIGAIGGTKGAIGLGTMGFAISAFLGGLLAGDILFAGVTALGGSLDFGAIGKAVTGVGTIFNGLDTKGLVVLGTLLGGATLASAFGGGKSAAKGLAFMGLAISGFLGGLLAGDLLFAGASALGVSLDFNNVKTMLTGFSSAIGALTLPAVAALGALMASGAIVGYSPLKAKSLAKGLFAISAGMVALMAGFAATDLVGAGALALGASADFSNVQKLMTGFSAAVGSLDTKSVATLGTLLAAGGALGAITTESMKAKFVLGAGALAASIVAFMGAFALGDAGVAALGSDGSSIATLVSNFGVAIDSLSGNSIKTLGALVGVGGILGAVTVATGGLGAAVFAGIPALGASIAGFFLAFEGMAAVGDIIGLNGENTKALLTNFGDGIGALTSLDMANADTVGKGLMSLSAGMAAFFGAQALGGVTSFFGAIGDSFRDGWNWLWGNDSETSSPFQGMIDALQPLKDLDDSIITKMDAFSSAMRNFITSFSGLEKINAGAGTTALGSMMSDIGAVLSMMDTMMKGGTYDTGSGPAIRLFGNKRGLIDFGPGLDSLNEETIDRLNSGVNNLRSALGRSQATDQDAANSIATAVAAQLAATINVGGSTVINKGGDTRHVQVFSNPRVSAQASWTGGF